MSPHLKLLFFLSSLALSIYGCQGNAPGNIPTPPPSPSIKYTNLNADPTCSCPNSARAFIDNPRTSPVRFRYTVTVHDTTPVAPGHPPNELLPITETVIVPAATSSGPGIYPLQCTIYQQPDCRFQATYKENGYSSLRLTEGTDAMIYGGATTPSLGSCTAWCSNVSNPNSSFCLPLGKRYYAAIAPLTEAIKAAQTGGGIVKHESLLKLYGLSPADDKCQRGDIITSNGKITNEGKTEYCTFKSKDLPPSFLTRMGIQADGGEDLRLVNTIQRRVEAESIPIESIKSINATDGVVFPENDTAPILTFEGPDAEQFTAEYGGRLLGTAYVTMPNGKRKLVAATVNGCLGIDEVTE